MTAPFALEPSPPDPQPVRVYRLDECTWWAGHSLQQCINDCQLQQDRWIDPAQCREVSLFNMLNQKFSYHEDAPTVSFAAELQRRIDAGEQFPQLFASTEY